MPSNHVSQTLSFTLAGAAIAAAVGMGALGGCAPDPVREPSTARYEACVIGYECAVECDDPQAELAELGCGPGDFESEAPNCDTRNRCAGAKEACFLNCEEELPEEEVRDCKIQCDVDFGNNSTCRDDFRAWLDERDEILTDFRTCLSPCEGRPSRKDCAGANAGGSGGDTDGDTEGETGGDDFVDVEGCNPVAFARHDAVTRVEDCKINGGSNCEWRCEDRPNGYYFERD